MFCSHRFLAGSKGLLLAICVALPRAVIADEPAVPDTQAETLAFTKPADSVARVRAPAGFNVELFAAEPSVRQPIAFTTDTRGRWQDIRQGTSATTAEAGGGHAHSGLMIYQGDNWPSEYRGRVFTINLHGRRLNRDELERSGAGYVAHHGQDCFFVDDPWFRGIDLLSGPDGSVFVIDWSDVGECHETDGVHRNSGRIFKLTHGKPATPKFGDVAKADDATILNYLTHENVWFSRQARRVLQERAAAGSDTTKINAALRSFFERESNVVFKLRALWCLNATGGCDESWLLEQLHQPDEHLRTWAVRLLADDRVSTTALARLVDHAKRESSGLVLLYLASALGRIETDQRASLAAALLAHSEFADDPRLPLLVWYGVEQLAQIAGSPKADTQTRRAAIQSLVLAKHVFCVPLLRVLLTDLDLGADAARGLAAFDDPANARFLVEKFGGMVPPARIAALETLASRPSFVAALLDGVERGVVKPGELSVFQVRQLQAIDDEVIRRRVAALWPELRPIAR
jgi:hypothetical protein